MRSTVSLRTIIYLGEFRRLASNKLFVDSLIALGASGVRWNNTSKRIEIQGIPDPGEEVYRVLVSNTPFYHNFHLDDTPLSIPAITANSYHPGILTKILEILPKKNICKAYDFITAADGKCFVGMFFNWPGNKDWHKFVVEYLMLVTFI